MFLHETATGPYPKPHESNPNSSILFITDISIYIRLTVHRDTHRWERPTRCTIFEMCLSVRCFCPQVLLYHITAFVLYDFLSCSCMDIFCFVCWALVKTKRCTHVHLLVFLTYRYVTIVLHGRINIMKWALLLLLLTCWGPQAYTYDGLQPEGLLCPPRIVFYLFPLLPRDLQAAKCGTICGRETWPIILPRDADFHDTF